MGTEIFLTIIALATIIAGVGFNNFIKKQNEISKQKRKKRINKGSEEERVAREKREIAYFAKYPEVYKIVKSINADGSSVSINIEDQYRSLFIEYIHRFKDFARIKGFTTDIKISAKENSKQLFCKFDIKPMKRSENKTSPEELFRNYLVSYPIFT